MIPSRNEAEKLLHEFTKSEALLNHAHAVEGVMRHYAALKSEDVEYWGAVGLLHDLDYEMYPDEHCTKVREILSSRNVDEDMIRAICSHGYGLCSDVEPERYMEKVLYTIDELTGLINACALMRPSHSVMDMELKSIKKKFKQPSFAAGVNRGIIEDGCARMGAALDDVMTETLMGMREVADAIGLGMDA